MNGNRIGAQRPRRHALPRRRVGSAGPDACEFAEGLGYELDDWQRWCIDGIFSEDDQYRLCATMVLILVSRQNGKNVILEVIELYAFYVLEWREIIHTAHLQDSSAGHMERLRLVIEANQEILPPTKFIEANGKERIVRTDTRGQIRFMTRSKKIGRSKSPRLIVLDEALFVTDDQVSAILPSMSAQSMKADQPILVYTSSAPIPESMVLHRHVARFAAGDLDGFFADWGSPVGTDPNDVDAWYASNPGLGIRISEAWVREQELAQMDPMGFAIERLGVIFAPDESTSELPEWPTCLDAASQMVGKPAVAVDVAPDLSWVSIAVAGARADKLTHVEVVERLTSVDDAVEVLKKLHKAHGRPIHLDPRAAAAAMIPDLLAAKVPVVEISTADLAKSCAHLKQLVKDGKVKHRGQIPLDQAVRSAAIRSIGDGWAWTRKATTVDISPLVAVTLAAWAARNDAPRQDAWIAWE